MAAQASISMANKDYRKAAFVLTDIKLTRIVEVVRERLARVQGESSLVENFKVQTRSQREVNAASLEQVLSLDNSVVNPIVGLEYRASTIDAGHLVVVRFYANETLSVRLHVRSENFVWVKETEGALEEQAERTIQAGVLYKLRGSWFDILGLLAALSVATTAIGGLLSRRTVGRLTSDESVELARAASAAHTDSEKLDYLFRLAKATTSPVDVNLSDYLLSPRAFLVGVPVLVTVLAVVAAVGWHYPSAVFEWGDWKQHHDKIVERRKFLWYGVVAAMVLGVLGNLFMLGLVPQH